MRITTPGSCGFPHVMRITSPLSAAAWCSIRISRSRSLAVQCGQALRCTTRLRHASRVAALRIPPPLRERPFRARDALADGLVSRRRLLGPEFQRVLHGVYVVAGTSIDHGVRCQAARLVLPPESVLTGHSAAWWYGVPFARDDAVVMVARPPGTRVDGPRHQGAPHAGPSRGPCDCGWDASDIAGPSRLGRQHAGSACAGSGYRQL